MQAQIACLQLLSCQIFILLDCGPDQASERKNFKIFLFSTARPFFPIAQIHFEYSPLFHGLAAHRLKALNALNLPLCLGKGRERGPQITLHHLACRKSCGPCDERWHETKQPLLLLSAREDSTKELCCNHFCLWRYTYDGCREAAGGWAVGWAVGGTKTRRLFAHGSKCSHLTC